jgi:hypothetical protein
MNQQHMTLELKSLQWVCTIHMQVHHTCKQDLNSGKKLVLSFVPAAAEFGIMCTARGDFFEEPKP